MSQFLIGVDEAGRGPLAGPVAVGIICAPQNLDIKKMFPNVADSKLLSPKKRELLYTQLQKAKREKILEYIVIFSSADTIDKIGITKAVRDAVWKGIRTISPEAQKARVLLDGLLSAPPEYAQKTIIQGDRTEPIISLASIAAKVERDMRMSTLAKQFPEYSFEIHKGYGTQKHLIAIQRFGLCAIHRKTFGFARNK